jgi:hypothetical protein
VRSRSGRPISSKLRWDSHRDAARAAVLMNRKVGGCADRAGEARGRRGPRVVA